MSGPDRPKQEGPSLGEVVGSVLGTVAEIGWSLLAAGRGVLAMASRLVRLAQEQWHPPAPEGSTGASAIGGEAGSASPSGAPVLAPAPRPPATSAVAFDAEPFSPPAVEGSLAGRRQLHPAPASPPLSPDLEPETPPLPERYGVDRLGVLARDPDTVFAWWEISDARRAEATLELEAREAEAAPAPPATSPTRGAVSGRSGDESGPAPVVGEALRVTALGDEDSSPSGSWLVPLPPLATSRYVEVPRTSQLFEVSLGLARDGHFVPLVEPQRVETPACEVSRDHSVRWRAVGESGEVAGGEPVAPGAAALWEEIRPPSLPASADWPPSPRLADLELGGSHTAAPRA